MNKQQQVENEDVLKQIFSYFAMWVGIVICVLSALSFFISTETMLRWLLEAEIEHQGNDSDASTILYNLQIKLLELGIWLKDLPLAAKIGGVVVGGLLWFSNADHD